MQLPSKIDWARVLHRVELKGASGTGQIGAPTLQVDGQILYIKTSHFKSCVRGCGLKTKGKLLSNTGEFVDVIGFKMNKEIISASIIVVQTRGLAADSNQAKARLGVNQRFFPVFEFIRSISSGVCQSALCKLF